MRFCDTSETVTVLGMGLNLDYTWGEQVKAIQGKIRALGTILKTKMTHPATKIGCIIASILAGADYKVALAA